MIGIGIIGLGNVFEGPYRTELAPLIRDGHVKRNTASPPT